MDYRRIDFNKSFINLEVVHQICIRRMRYSAMRELSLTNCTDIDAQILKCYGILKSGILKRVNFLDKNKLIENMREGHLVDFIFLTFLFEFQLVRKKYFPFFERTDSALY